MSESPKVFEEVALTIGRMCMTWAAIKYEAERLAIFLAIGHDPGLLRQEARSTLRIALCHMEQRELFATLRAYAFVAGLSPELMERVEAYANHVDNTLRPIRNRFVHDTWGLAKTGRPMRWERRFKIVNVQARVRELRSGKVETYESREDLERFAGELELALDETRQLQSAVWDEVRRQIRQLGFLQRLALAYRNSTRRAPRDQGKR